MTWTQQLAIWWISFVAVASVLLVVVLVAGRSIRQPVQRMAMAWSAMIGLVILAVCCAVPGWPRVSLVGMSSVSSPVLNEIKLKPAAVKKFSSPRQNERPSAKELAPSNDANVRQPVARALPQIHEPTADRLSDYSRTFFAALLAGALLAAVWLIFGQIRAWRICGRAVAAPEHGQQELRSLVASRGRLPRLLVDARFATAGAIGLWRPAILLPADVVQPGSSEAALRAVLAHEWAHIKRGDLWLLALGRVLLVLLYAHPLYWLLRRQILADQELIADAAAADYCGRHEYAEILVAWARRRPRAGSNLRGALGVWERPSQVSRRIAMLLDERIHLRMDCSRGWRIGNGCVMLGLVLVLSLLTLNPAPVAKGDTKADAPAVAVAGPVAKGEAKPPFDKLRTEGQAVEITGKCVDVKHKPVVDAHVMVFRIDHSDKTTLVPHGRMKMAKEAPGGASIKSQLAYNYMPGDPDKQRIIGEARTDRAGKFRISGLKTDESWLSQQDTVYVAVQAPGKGTMLTNAILQHVGERLVAIVNPTLQKAASLRGRITNAEGQPVAGAIVTCGELNFLPKPMIGICCAKTDAHGQYDISDLDAIDLANDVPAQITPFGAIQRESMVLSVEHPDYAPGVIEFTKIPSEHDLVLQRPAMLRGQVTDFDGKAAKKAYVSWAHENGLADGTTTDGEGMYSLSRLEPGKYTIAAGRDDRVKNAKELTLKSGEQRLDLQLRQGARLKARIVQDSKGNDQNVVGYTPWGQPIQTVGDSNGAVNAVRSTIYQLQATVDGRDPMRAITGSSQPDGSFSMIVEPGRNHIYLVNPDLKVVDAEKWAKQGIELAAGQIVEIELHVVSRPGGWTAWMDELKAAELAEKGLPAPPATKPTEQVANVGQSEEERMMKEYWNWPTDLVPEKPMSEEAVMQWLSGLQGEVEYKTIDGEDCVTSIVLNAEGPGGFADPQVKSAFMWVEYSLLAHIDKFPHLESLGFVGTSCDGKWLAPLRGHKKLQSLILSFMQNLDSTGIQTLATLPKLNTLGMTGVTLDDSVLRAVSQLPKLETLQFGGPFSDNGVAYLRDNSRLKGLVLYNLGRGKVTNETLRHVGSLTNLESFAFLSMGGDLPLTDDGLKYLANSTKLEELAIQGDRITDAGLDHLYGLKSLKKLVVTETSVTQGGVDELKKRLPKVKVTLGNENNAKAGTVKSGSAESQR